MLDFDEADHAYVYAVVYRILETPDLASDATPDTLLRAYVATSSIAVTPRRAPGCAREPGPA